MIQADAVGNLESYGHALLPKLLRQILSRRLLSLLFAVEVLTIAWFAFAGGNLQGQLQNLFRVDDHFLHVAAFACAGVTAFLLWSPLWATTMLASGAMTIELVQRFIPGRESSLADLAASFGGLAVGVSGAVLVGFVFVPLLALSSAAGTNRS